MQATSSRNYNIYYATPVTPILIIDWDTFIHLISFISRVIDQSWETVSKRIEHQGMVSACQKWTKYLRSMSFHLLNEYRWFD